MTYICRFNWNKDHFSCRNTDLKPRLIEIPNLAALDVVLEDVLLKIVKERRNLLFILGSDTLLVNRLTF